MGLACGIVGLPNVGKSTLFNALTNAGAQSENYPFCTIEPNIGMVELIDFRLKELAKIASSAKIIFAPVEFVDIAGLVKGASDNAGLGNRFLSHIRETDGIIHVVRCFEDDNIVHVHNCINPVDDIEVINLELVMADLSTVENTLNRHRKTAKSGDKEAQVIFSAAEKLHNHLKAGLVARSCELTEKEQAVIKPLCLLTLKRMFYVANCMDNGIEDNPHLEAVQAYAKNEGVPVIPICVQTEADIVDWTEEEKIEYLQSMNIRETGLSRLIREAFDLLGLMTYFTVGPKEARAWTIRKNTTAPRAAAAIHEDFERGFIRAEVINWQVYLDHATEVKAREAGKIRLEGKEYIVEDGDVMHFRFNV